MKFTPVNRYIHVSMPEEEPHQLESGIVLPDDFKPAVEQHTVVTIKGWAEDVKFKQLLWVDHQLIVDRTMVEEVTLGNEKVQVVLENYVIGIL